MSKLGKGDEANALLVVDHPAASGKYSKPNFSDYVIRVSSSTCPSASRWNRFATAGGYPQCFNS